MNSPTLDGEGDGASARSTARSQPAIQVTESQAIEAVDQTATRRLGRRRGGVTEIPYTRLGFRIFGAILILTALMIAILGVFAVITYPSAADAHAILGSSITGPAALNDWQDMQAEWFDQVTRLA